ncbi:ABC transporter permease [Pelagibacterium montanilacus]|uniref:ABC transporter permease n=1 Tax=Pelagibacterium montanilacus TaxID=2185280 RepID=UPI000F8DF0D2|nr:ABC transporter permease subunit [Pelagibacterium montanilacus]
MIALYRLGFLALLVLLWMVGAQAVGRNLIPTPGDTLAAALEMIGDGRLAEALAESLAVYLSGFAIAAVVGIASGVAMGMIAPLGRTLDIYAFALAATPRVAFIPLIIVLLGLGLEAKVFIVFLGAVMPVLITTYSGVKAADAELIEMGRSVGAPGRRILLEIVLPGAVPFIVAGLRLGATVGLINTVVAELYTAVSGLGGLLALYGNTFRMAEYFVIVLCLAAIGVVVTEGLRLIESRLDRWRPHP